MDLKEVKLRVIESIEKQSISHKANYYWNLNTLKIDPARIDWDKFNQDPEYIPPYGIECHSEDKPEYKAIEARFNRLQLQFKEFWLKCTCKDKDSGII